VRRISVAGTAGSGKSTLARELASALQVPHLELDSVFHQPGWTPLPRDEFRARVGRFAAQDGWVTDGNYSAVQDLIWKRADTVAWLDLPRHLVMRRLLLRTVRRVMTREELWNGNRESWRGIFSLDPERSILVWAWTTHARNRARYLAASEDPVNAHLTFVHLTSPRAVRRFLAAAREEAPGAAAGKALPGGRLQLLCGRDHQAAQPRVRRLVLVLAVPPQRLHDRL
jgi:adenylate kinase family enzyme